MASSPKICRKITASDAEDVPVPGRAFTFGELKRAQALGDFQSLASHARPVVRVQLGRNVDAGLDALLVAVRDAVSARTRER